jgi:hypothetical protein
MRAAFARRLYDEKEFLKENFRVLGRIRIW